MFEPQLLIFFIYKNVKFAWRFSFFCHIGGNLIFRPSKKGHLATLPEWWGSRRCPGGRRCPGRRRRGTAAGRGRGGRGRGRGWRGSLRSLAASPAQRRRRRRVGAGPGGGLPAKSPPLQRATPHCPNRNDNRNRIDNQLGTMRVCLHRPQF